jgi:uncharacterized membrane protein YeiH
MPGEREARPTVGANLMTELDAVGLITLGIFTALGGGIIRDLEPHLHDTPHARAAR